MVDSEEKVGANDDMVKPDKVVICGVKKGNKVPSNVVPDGDW